jgi:hypothetical protein
VVAPAPPPPPAAQPVPQAEAPIAPEVTGPSPDAPATDSTSMKLPIEPVAREARVPDAPGAAVHRR